MYFVFPNQKGLDMEHFCLTEGEKLIIKDEGTLWGNGIAHSLRGVLMLTSERLVFAQREKNSLAMLFSKTGDYRVIQNLPLSRVSAVRYITQGTPKSIISILYGDEEKCYFCELNGADYDWVSLISDTTKK
jgi:hypothetical protein